ncbi:MAG: family 78 glycoside hydrolase catalytic domain [Dysgonamonadaceae bacterium]|jgi:alpha-L-rhamnosidase|nr:family 78 glycoside hydrolase catalytic domain [Dysgonamonadaceae bacterium]
MKKLFFLVYPLITVISNISAQSVSVVNLRCEYLNNPLGIDIPHPRLSWELASEAQNKAQRAYQIMVATDEKALAADKVDAWDTRKIKSGETNQIYYAGETLMPNTMYYWKVRVWDEKGEVSAWSSAARFLAVSMADGVRKGLWVGEKTLPIPLEEQYYQHEGYSSVPESTADALKQAVIDLGNSQQFDAVKIYPYRRKEWIFPLRFTVEAADNAEFSNTHTIADETQKDVIIQSDEFYYKKLSSPISARYIRLNVIRMATEEKDKTDKFQYGIAEIEILNNFENIALNKPVTATDTKTSNYLWEVARITDGHLRRSNTKNYFDHIPPAPLLRAEISISKRIRNAFWSVSAQGLYEAYINGKKVGNHCLAPEFTDYDSHLQFQTYEVTDLLREGKNALGAMLADGWFAGARWSFPNRGGYGYFRKFIGQLLVNYHDGSSEVICTDGTWKIWAQGPIREASNFIGEVYDADYEQKGWTEAGFDDKSWKAVSTYPDDRWNLVAQRNEPIVAINEIKAVSVYKVGKDKYVFDLGQNMPGWVRLTLPYNPGNPIQFRYGECVYDDGSLYTDNLRDAKQIDVYRPSDEKNINYEPRFTYHGFRFVEVEGLKQTPQKDNITGIVVASSSPVVSSFACSNKDLNQLFSNIRWTLWGNLISIPTDCPQRDEREGWMADAQIFSQTACYNLDMASFYTKWARDISDSQIEDGRFPDIAPHDGTWRQIYGAPGWADAGNIIPWRIYENYNDKKILATQYESMRRWVDYNIGNNPDLIWRNKRFNDYNDWLNGNWISNIPDYPKDRGSLPQPVFATAYLAYSTDIVANSARLLGKKEDVQKYSKLAADIRVAFVKEFVSPDGKIQGETQAGYAIALHFDILPDNLREKAVEQMLEAVKYYDYRISTGIHGTVMLMEQLSRYGHSDVAWRLLLSHRFPSWLYSVDQGATTIWERWDGYVAGRGFQDAGMNSLNHVAIGAVGEWFYRHILGIQKDDAKPGFRHFFIKPEPGPELTWAKGNYHSINGDIEVSWTNESGRFAMDLTVPANTTATVVLPDGTKKEVKSGKYRF